MHVLLMLLTACDSPTFTAPSSPGDFCQEAKSVIGPDDPTSAELSANELVALLSSLTTLNLSWDTTEMAPWSHAVWSLSSDGEESTQIERWTPDGQECDARVETSFQGHLDFDDGGSSALRGRAFGSFAEGGHFRGLDIEPALSQAMEAALIESMYARNPANTFREDWRGDIFPHAWVLVAGDEGGGTLTIINEFSRADTPPQRVVAQARWTVTP